MTREVMKQALEALEDIASWYGHDRSVGALASSMYEASCLAKVQAAALRQALEQPADEPAFWYYTLVVEGEIVNERFTTVNWDTKFEPFGRRGIDHGGQVTKEPLYTRPQPADEPVIDNSAAIRIATALGWEPKREWAGLTDDEINKLRYKKDWTAPWTDTTFARAIEAKLKEKNT